MFFPFIPIPLQYVEDNLGVMSVGFLLSSPDDAVIWRGPKKNGLSLCSSVYSQTIRETVVFDAITLIVGMELRTSSI